MNKELTIEANESLDGAIEACELTEDLGTKKVGKKIGIALCVTAIGVGIAALVRKNRGKFDELLAKKLRKKGYTVVKPLEDIDCVDADSSKVESQED